MGKHFHFIILLASRASQLELANTNEIKRDIQLTNALKKFININKIINIIMAIYIHVVGKYKKENYSCVRVYIILNRI